MALILGVVA